MANSRTGGNNQGAFPVQRELLADIDDVFLPVRLVEQAHFQIGQQMMNASGFYQNVDPGNL